MEQDRCAVCGHEFSESDIRFGVHSPPQPGQLFCGDCLNKAAEAQAAEANDYELGCEGRVAGYYFHFQAREVRPLSDLLVRLGVLDEELDVKLASSDEWHVEAEACRLLAAADLAALVATQPSDESLPDWKAKVQAFRAFCAKCAEGDGFDVFASYPMDMRKLARSLRRLTPSRQS